MAIKIKMSGTTISDNSQVLNGLHVQGGSNSDITIDESSVRGKAQVLNNAIISGNSSVKAQITNSKIKENARVLNNLDVQNGKFNVEIENLSLGKDVEFMDGKKVTNRPSTKQASQQNSNMNQSSRQRIIQSQTSHKQHSTKTSSKKDGLLKKFLSLLFGEKTSEQIVQEEPQSYARQKYKDFEYEISRGNTLKGIDVSAALRYVDEEIAKEQKEANRGTNNRDEK